MEWTRVKPSQQGFYWIRSPEIRGGEATIVGVDPFPGGDFQIAFPGTDAIKLVSQVEAEWAGPIDLPEGSGYLYVPPNPQQRKNSRIYVVVSLPYGGSFYSNFAVERKVGETISRYLKTLQAAGRPVPVEVVSMLDNALVKLAIMAGESENKRLIS